MLARAMGAAASADNDDYSVLLRCVQPNGRDQSEQLHRSQQLREELQNFRDLLEFNFQHLHDLSEGPSSEEQLNSILSNLLATAGGNDGIVEANYIS